jgi:hypothetical protein
LRKLAVLLEDKKKKKTSTKKFFNREENSLLNGFKEAFPLKGRRKLLELNENGIVSQSTIQNKV